MGDDCRTSEVDKRCIASVVDFLRSEANATPEANPDAIRQLNSAADALRNIYSLQSSDDGCSRGVNLREIYAAGCKALNLGADTGLESMDDGASRNGGRAANGKSIASGSQKSQASNEAGFSKFVDRLKETTDFFKDIEEGSPEYEKRMSRARAKFESKLAQKRAAEGGSAKASASSKAAKTPDSSDVGSRSAPGQSQAQSAPSASPEAKARGDALKAEGNTLLGKKDYKGAYDAYSKAIKEDGQNAVYYSNRAAALIHLDRFTEAVGDCEVAIRLDGSFVRARERMASAYRHLGMHECELDALEGAVAIRPDDEKLRKDVDAARARVDAFHSRLSTREGETSARESAQRSGGAAEAGASAGGAPDFKGMMGEMEGIRGMGAVMEELTNNPAIARMANNPAVQQMMQEPEFLSSLAANPQIGAMMRNPEIMRSMMSGLGLPTDLGTGAGGGAGSGGARSGGAGGNQSGGTGTG